MERTKRGEGKAMVTSSQGGTSLSYPGSGRELQQALIDHGLALPGAEATAPFGPEHLVLKVGGKMFALTTRDEVPPRFNLKCAPERAIALRATFPAILPGYHMNKQHWNTVVLDGSLPLPDMVAMLDHSYELVLASLPRALRARLQPGT